MREDPSLGAEIARLASRQHGYVTRQQLLALGLGSGAVQYRVVTGRLIRVHLGVYAVGHVPTERIARDAAAVLACGPDAALCRRSAARLWKMRPRWTGSPEVTSPTAIRRPGIHTHRSRTLASGDIVTHHGIRVTSPAWTLLGITPLLTDPQVRRAANDGRLAGYLHLDAVAELLARSAGRAGAARLARLISDGAPTRSLFEDEFRRFVERHSLPKPLMNVSVGGYEVDVLFPDERVVVELDGFLYHQDRGAFERDRRRDADLLAIGVERVRLTWERMTGAPGKEAGLLLSILEGRRA